jgi:8-oxo-dGTP pyrophosphatase MutT (NUDIX family)
MAKEMVDFFDEKEKFVLTAAKRTKYKENSNLYIKGVYILIINSNKEILIQRKREDHSKLNRWEIPSGHVDSGESFEEAAKRELKEETGIIVPLSHLKTIKTENPNELDAFYAGRSNFLPDPKDNPEVDAFEFISFDNLLNEIKNGTRLFAPQLIKFLKANGQDFKKKFISSLNQPKSISKSS